MTVFEVGSVRVEINGVTSSFKDKPARDSEEQIGQAALAELSTPDGFVGTLGVITWPGGTVDVRLVDFAQGGVEYERMKGAGTMNLKVSGDKWVIRVRALKKNGKDWPTLNRVSWVDMDWLLGADAQTFLKDHGALRFADYGDLTQAGPAQRGDLGMEVAAGNVDAIAALYAITRVLAIMKSFGKDVAAGVIE